MCKKLFVIAAAALVISACESGTKETDEKVVETTTEVTKEEKIDTEVAVDVETVVEEGEFEVLLASYYDLKNALVASDPSKAKEAAKKIESLASEDMKGIMEDAQHIQETDELEHMREHFELMSDGVYKMAKEQDMSATVYKQYCPMAFDNKGAFWLSSEKEIRNPYFGDKMLKCGRVEEEI